MSLTDPGRHISVALILRGAPPDTVYRSSYLRLIGHLILLSIASCQYANCHLE